MNWQWFRLRQDDGGTKVMPMPETYVCEMVGDWIGAGRAMGKPNILAWYEANREKMELHPESRALAERLLAEQGRY